MVGHNPAVETVPDTDTDIIAEPRANRDDVRNKGTGSGR